ncbi:MAG TPA: hypothetical protein VN695_04695 [Streptosporangiaceae bacterium]|nr:hypothetical protein [Streptosporangiaceae bacterium]
MPIADLLPGRLGPSGRLPDQIDDLKGPVKGVLMLPMHLSWPGMRECDVSDDATRRSMYGMLLSQGKRNDIVRFINAGLLAADWPLIADSLEPKLRRLCERVFALGEAQPGESQSAAEAAPAPDGAATIKEDGAIA